MVVMALREAGAEVHAHDDHFPAEAPDEEWLAEVGRRGWVVLTRDGRSRYRPLERAALISGRRARLRPGRRRGSRGEQMAAVFVKALPRIERFVAENPAPFIARVNEHGQATLLVDR